MQAGFGGSVWHASVAWHGRLLKSQDEYEARAFWLLRGVGDVEAGQWIERNPRFTHVRRRLSIGEQMAHEVRDIRRTNEAIERWHALPTHVRKRAPEYIIFDETGLTA